LIKVGGTCESLRLTWPILEWSFVIGFHDMWARAFSFADTRVERETEQYQVAIHE
jgi:hypothetical protein